MVREDIPVARWAVVVPSNRPDRIVPFLEKWMYWFELHDADVIICDDTPDGSLLKGKTVPSYVSVYGRDVWPEHIPRGTDMCRSFGFWKAHSDCDYILSLDDDVHPSFNVDLFYEYEQVFLHGLPFSSYLNVGALTSYGKPMRGFPFDDRDPAPVAVQWGGWSGVLDYDAPTQMKGGLRNFEDFDETVVPVPAGTPVTGCAMNMAFRASWAPIMWQLPLLEGRYNRWGDIWSGLLAKKTADLHQFSCAVNGRARVSHSRASDPHANLAKELPGIPFNEVFWRKLVSFPGKIPTQTYRRLIAVIVGFFSESDPEYSDHLFNSYKEWRSMFDE